jgi:4-amino-4-deoxy-L-arabinose transferase-like glycosyltransferase
MIKPENKMKCVYAFLVFLIFVGIFVRFWGIGDSWLEGDEGLYMVSAIKLNHDGNPYDPRMYLNEHPPVARWFLGMPTRFINADYTAAITTPPQMYVYSYFVPFREVYIPIRLVSAFFGFLSVILVFLITKEIFGKWAGIWAALLASFSFDLIFYSRWALSESVFVGLSLFTVFFYVKYLKSEAENRKTIFVILTMIFLTLCLGTRSYSPLLMVPVLLISQFIIKRGKNSLKENVVFTMLVLASIYVFFELIWSPPAYQAAQKFFQAGSLLQGFQFSLHWVAISIIFRNSYIFLFSFILLLYGFCLFIRKDSNSGLSVDFTKIKKYLKSSNLSILLLVFVFVCIAGFGLTQYYLIRYQVMLFLPLYVLGGRALEKYTKNKKVLIASLLLVVMNLFFFVRVYPYYAEYQNFSLDKCGDYMIGCSTTAWQNHVPELKEAMSYLAQQGSPPVMTNEFNILTFYAGNSVPLIASGEQRCNQNDAENFARTYKYIIYWGSRGNQPDLRTDPYVCQYIRQTPMELVKSFGNRMLSGIDPETLKVKLYRINI